MYTLRYKNVYLPSLRGEERLVDRVDLDEDESLGGLAVLFVVAPHKLNPPPQVFAKGEPDCLHPVLERQFEEGNVRGLRLLQLPTEKAGPERKWSRGPIQGPARDGQLVPVILESCIGWPSHVVKLKSSPSWQKLCFYLVPRNRNRQREKLQRPGHPRSPLPLEPAQ